MKKDLQFFVSAGEYSGDLLGAKLALDIKQAFPRAGLSGVCGSAMTDAGVKPLLHISELNVMGFAEVLANIARLRMLERSLLEQLDRNPPDIAILIDFPGLHFRLAEQLKMRGVKVVQFVAPKLWAWGEHRTEKLRNDFDAVMGIFSFEEDFFRSRGVNYHYVGCPHLERVHSVRVTKAALGLDESRRVVSFLPGSRVAEVKHILPVLLRICKLMKEKEEVDCVIPLCDGIDIDAMFSPSMAEDVRNHFRIMPGMSLELMSVADACVVASGTATLECALVGTPLAVVYVMSDMTYEVAKKVVKTNHVSLVNLIMQRTVVSEHIQHFSAQTVADEIIQLMSPGELRDKMMADFQELKQNLYKRDHPSTVDVVSTVLGVEP